MRDDRIAQENLGTLTTLLGYCFVTASKRFVAAYTNVVDIVALLGIILEITAELYAVRKVVVSRKLSTWQGGVDSVSRRRKLKTRNSFQNCPHV